MCIILFGGNKKARERLEKSLMIQKELGYRSGAANGYGNLGYVYHSIGVFWKGFRLLGKVNGHQQKHL